MAKIAFISTLGSTPWGGSEELWSLTALHFAESGHAVGASVQWWPRPAPRLQELERAGCHVDLRRERNRLNVILGDRFSQRHLRWLERFAPDFVVMSMDSQVSGLNWMQACQRLQLPYVLIIQSVLECYWQPDAANLSLAAGYEAARACYFVSERNLESTQMQLATTLPQAQVVRNPFAVSYGASVPWPQSDEYKLACIGRLDPVAKGQDILFEVLSQNKWRERPLQVSLFGDGPYKQSLQRLQRFYKLNNVNFAGSARDIEAVWAQHHALVLPSRYEGLPLVVVEAMLCARPCIVTDVAGNAEILEDNVSGFVAAAPHTQFLDEALERAWQRRHEWQQMGERAANRVRECVPPDPPEAFANELKQLL